MNATKTRYSTEFLNQVMPEISEDVWQTECGQYTLKFVECEPDTFVYILTDNWNGTTQEFMTERMAQAHVVNAIYGVKR